MARKISTILISGKYMRPRTRKSLKDEENEEEDEVKLVVVLRVVMMSEWRGIEE